MEHTAEWKIKLFLFEHDNGSTAQVVLDTGVTTSLTIDPHGKTLSYALLEMMIEQ